MIDATFKRHGEPVTVTTTTPGFRNDNGEWQAGNEHTTATMASVEPMGADAADQIPTGARLEDTRIFFIDPSITGISSGGAETAATTIMYAGNNYRAAKVESWSKYTKIIATRIT